jgi:uncharacterized protein YbjT (DUF2867 family)
VTTGDRAPAALDPPRSEEELEARLSQPTPEVLEALAAAPGDVVVLGAGGKMGPSLTAMVARGAQELGDTRRVTAVSRWSDPDAAARLERLGVRLVRGDLLDPALLAALPEAPNVLYLAGHKFGTRDAPHRSWMTNTVLAARAAERYRHARIVAFSTGNVYPLVASTSAGSREDDALGPVGEYAMSCVGRERVFEDACARWGTRVALLRLNYAVDLRYGVLVDLAQRIVTGTPIDLTMGHVNCIWQGDANAIAVRTLPLVGAPPFVVNVTGPARLSVRQVASVLGERLGRAPVFEGTEAADALLSDTARLRAYLGPLAVPEATLLEWVADWVRRGGRTLGKATRFERRDGGF